MVIVDLSATPPLPLGYVVEERNALRDRSLRVHAVHEALRPVIMYCALTESIIDPAAKCTVQYFSIAPHRHPVAPRDATTTSSSPAHSAWPPRGGRRAFFLTLLPPAGRRRRH